MKYINSAGPFRPYATNNGKENDYEYNKKITNLS